MAWTNTRKRFRISFRMKPSLVKKKKNSAKQPGKKEGGKLRKSLAEQYVHLLKL